MNKTLEALNALTQKADLVGVSVTSLIEDVADRHYQLEASYRRPDGAVLLKGGYGEGDRYDAIVYVRPCGMAIARDAGDAEWEIKTAFKERLQ